MAGIRVTTQRYSFQLVHDAELTYPTGADVGCPREAIAIAQHVIGSEITECLLAIFVDARHRVTGYTEIARGTLNANRFTPRDVLVPALHANACALVICHNHPSNVVDPSAADRRVTVALREACSLVGISLLDHLIVSTHDHYSFRQHEGWG
jgi:DNA repair protein RadC